MSKKQIYTFTFNDPQTDVASAMRSVGSHFSNEVNLIDKFMLNNNIYDNTDPYLSPDGKKLSVERIWSDDAYNAFMEIATIEEIIDKINSLNFVTVEQYDFVDV